MHNLPEDNFQDIFVEVFKNLCPICANLAQRS